VFHLYVVRCARRDALQTFLKDRGVATGIHYPIALPNLKAYAYLENGPDAFPVAGGYQSQILSLPMFPELEPEAIAYIAAQIREFCATKV
jgi:dTDP-4-amino-4,6-dideoxygalactose transaminase